MNINVVEMNLIIDGNIFDIGNLFTYLYIQEEINEIPKMFLSIQNTNNILNTFNIQGGEKITLGLKDNLDNYQVTEWIIADIKTEYNQESIDARFLYEGLVLFECRPEWYIINQRISKTYTSINEDICSVGIREILQKYFSASDNEISIEDDIEKKNLLICENPFNSLRTLSEFAVSKSYTPYLILFRNITTVSGNEKYIIKSFKTLYEENSNNTKQIAFSNNNRDKLFLFNNDVNNFICVVSFIPEILKINNILENHDLFKKEQNFNIETGKFKYYSSHLLEVLDNNFIYDKHIDIDDTYFNFNFVLEKEKSIETSKKIIDNYINKQMKYNKVVLNIVSKLSINIGDVIRFNNIENPDDKYLLKNFMVSKVKHIFTRSEVVTEVTLFGIDISLQNFANLNNTFGEVE